MHTVWKVELLNVKMITYGRTNSQCPEGRRRKPQQWKKYQYPKQKQKMSTSMRTPNVSHGLNLNKNGEKYTG